MRYELPLTNAELIASAQAEYTAAQAEGGEAVREAQHRLAWALVHAEDKSKIRQGLELAEQLLDLQGGEQREAEYYRAVGLYRTGQYSEARTKINAMLEKWPNFNQATELKGLIEDGLIRDGLFGVGVGVGVGAVVVGLGAVAASVLAKLASSK